MSRIEANTNPLHYTFTSRMPRVPPRLLRQTYATHRSLPSLLPVCRDLTSAQNELRWLQEHAVTGSQSQSGHGDGHLLRGFVERRASGEPLQYILGSEYFGDLEIICRKGVLIPRFVCFLALQFDFSSEFRSVRQETAASVTHLVHRLASDLEITKLRVIDLCTGTGCIPLLFHLEFYRKYQTGGRGLELAAVDISKTALALARENWNAQRKAQSHSHDSQSTRLQSLEAMKFVEADVLNDDVQTCGPKSVLKSLQELYRASTIPRFDVLISNPPYISSKAFRTTTARSVRAFEPRLALVPKSSGLDHSTPDGDIFYPHLLRLAEQVKAKVMLFEVADINQAKRVAALCIRQGHWENVEIWRDDPRDERASTSSAVIGRKTVAVRGTGHGRSVFAYRAAVASWFVG